MISAPSLLQNFMPNVYVKNVTLNSELKSVENKQQANGYFKPTSFGGEGGGQIADSLMVPDDTMSSTITISSKFLDYVTLENDLLKLVDSATTQGYTIFIHQTTDRAFYESVLQVDYNKAAAAALPPGALPIELINELTKVYNSETTKTKQVNFFESFVESNDGPTKLNENLGEGVSLPKQILPDGTTIKEVITKTTFNGIPTNTDFLAYIVFSYLDHTFKLGTIVDDINYAGFYFAGNSFASNIKKEIVLLDKKIQNQAIQFRIAQPSAGENAAALLKFGKPGDIWAGGVHFHMNRFMAGSSHSPSEPHPYLDLSIVPNNRFVDNRIKNKIEKSIINVTQKTEELNSFVSMYKNSPKNLNLFKQKENFISDIYLTQDKYGSVQGSFIVDKRSAIENNSLFSFIFSNAKKILTTEQYNNFRKFIISDVSPRRCQVYRGSELLGTVTPDQPNTSTTGVPGAYEQLLKQKGYTQQNIEELKAKYPNPAKAAQTAQRKQTTIFFSLTDENKAPDGNKIKMPSAGGSPGVTVNTTSSELGYDVFSFKHVMSDSYLTTQKYSVVVEYDDPTVFYLQTTLAGLDSFNNGLSAVLSFTKSKVSLDGSQKFTAAAYDRVTDQLKPAVIDKLMQKGYLTTNSNENFAFPNGFQAIPYSAILATFYNPEVVQDFFSTTDSALLDLQTYMTNICNLRTTTLTNLLILKNFFDNISSRMSNLISSFKAKQPFTNNPTPYTNAITSTESPSGQSLIELKSSEYEIQIYNYGYDFTGVKNHVIAQNARFDDTEGLLTINRNLYERMLDYLLSEITPGAPYTLPANIDDTFSPIGGLPARSYRAAHYSYLCAPVQVNPIFKDFLILPETFTFKDCQSGLTQVAKLKSEILEGNSVDAIQSIPTNIKENLVSIFNKDGTDIATPSKILQEILTPLGATADETASNILVNPVTNLITVGDNELKIDPLFTKIFTKSGLDGDTVSNDKNNLLMALFSRKNMLDLPEPSPQVGFALKVNALQESFIPNDDNPPNQVMCLCLANPESGPFKNFQLSDASEGYIIGGLINPARLSQYFFTHENIVRVEYLSGFETTTTAIPAKTTIGNPYHAPEPTSYTKTSRNLKKPQWKQLESNAYSFLLNAGTSGLLCRLVLYKSNYINGHLVEKFKLPLINSYFKLVNEL